MKHKQDFPSFYDTHTAAKRRRAERRVRKVAQPVNVEW